jgi:hypothetical protein
MAQPAADSSPFQDSQPPEPAADSSSVQDTQQDGARVSQFAAHNWAKAKEAVQRTVGLSTAFNTLRDMQTPAAIRPDQLSTIKVLGQGAFARVDACM